MSETETVDGRPDYERPGESRSADVDSREVLRAFVHKRLLEYRLGVARIHVHRSASTNAHDLRVTLDRSAHLASLTAIERFLEVAIQRRYQTRLRSVFWRYRPSASERVRGPSPPSPRTAGSVAQL